MKSCFVFTRRRRRPHLAGGRTIRDVNPHALAKGTIFVQCSHCDTYHQLVDNLELIEEYDFRDPETT